jgi:activator of 2-hydroxyglutaryl-CoA dehydratase
MKPLKRANRKTVALNELETVFEKEDFKRQVMEVSQRENIPHDIVETVIKNYIQTVTKTMFIYKYSKKRITLYGFMNIEIKKFFKKIIN